ncbi:MAG: hypothetical protein LBG13_00800 [Holosporales bacterium]|jgi:uncharacterized membrane protein|nr:hypothetical protein [Holosporales bacterium]
MVIKGLLIGFMLVAAASADYDDKLISSSSDESLSAAPEIKLFEKELNEIVKWIKIKIEKEEKTKRRKEKVEAKNEMEQQEEWPKMKQKIIEEFLENIQEEEIL